MTGTIVAKIVFENSSYQTFGELPRIGSHAPDFSLVNTRLQDVSLAAWTGKRKILNIFVSIDTPVCAESVRQFDRHGRGHDNLALLMVSYDLPFAHKRYQGEHDLENVEGLSAIRHAGFGENYGVQIMDGPLAGMFSRAVVVLDENNTVVHREHVEDILQEPDYAAAFRALGIDIDE
ncbi:MAG: thiol peroxidase [Woeseiaceae bacterium]|nr:thiol peroxidase [Woeseiaceae bacterium]